MAKAVLIMNMPENCFRCKLQNWANCKITNKCHVGECRPDWCPLRELPERETEMTDADDLGNDYVRGTMDGWNNCLDMILREESLKKME